MELGQRAVQEVELSPGALVLQAGGDSLVSPAGGLLALDHLVQRREQCRLDGMPVFAGVGLAHVVPDEDADDSGHLVGDVLTGSRERARGDWCNRRLGSGCARR